MNTILAALRLLRDIAGADALNEWRGEELTPGPGVDTEEQLRDYLRRGTRAYWHPVGTCRISTDPGAVTDLELRVRGIEALRVADASVMPSIAAANTNATVLAIAERAASLLTPESRRKRQSAGSH